MDIVIKIIQFILCFSLLVFVHELGHFLFAKLFKIRVEKFYLFFNPWFSLFKFKWKDTEYGMGWIPFGGYVSISGMIDETKDSTQMASEPQPWEFRSKPAWQRFLVMVGGVLMNIITAVVIFMFLVYSNGNNYIDSKDVKAGYTFTETAQSLGFQNGDKIISVNGESYDNHQKYREAIIINNAPKVIVERNGEMVSVQLKESDIPKLLADQQLYALRIPFGVDSVVIDGAFDKAGITSGDSIISINGINIGFTDQLHQIAHANAGREVEVVRSTPLGVVDTLAVMVSQDSLFGVASYETRVQNFYKVTHHQYTFLESIPQGFIRTWDMCSSYVKQMKMVFNPETKAYKSVGSIITMGNLFPSSWDWNFFWNITALFSVILAVMNILPIPALDGGHVLLLLIEIITGRRLSDKAMERVQTVGFYILIGIMVLALWNDVMKFIL